MYDEINRYVQKKMVFRILVCARKPNRHWKYDEFKTDYTILLRTRKFKTRLFDGGYYAANLKNIGRYQP